MPIADIQLPDGRVAEIEVPKGATNEQITQFAKSQFSSSGNQAMTSAGGGIPGEFPETQDMRTEASGKFPEIFKSGILNGEPNLKVAKFAALAAVTPNERELANIATSIFPEMGVSEDEAGNIYLANNKNGVKAIINKPGPSLTDLAQFGGLGAAFAPSGRVIGPLKQALTSGGIQAGIEGAQALGGGEFNTEEVAMSGGIGAATQVPGMIRGVNKVARTPASQEARQIIRAGEEANIPVLTSDLVPPQTKAGGLLRQYAEIIPVPGVGTGAIRGKQSKLREDFVKAFAESVPPVNDQDIIKSLVDKKDLIKRAAGNRYQQITQAMDSMGTIKANKTIQSIDNAIAELSKPNVVPDPAAVSVLKSYREYLSKPQTFTSLKENRTRFSDELNSVDVAGRSQMPSNSKRILTQVKNSITEDMDDFMKSKNPRLFDKYKQADTIYRNEFQRLSESRLKNVLDKGDVTPEQYKTLMFSGKESEQKILYNSLTSQGKANARLAVLNDIVEKAGGQDITPLTFNRELKRRSKQIDNFFRGSEREQLKGLQRLFDATRRATDAKAITATGQQVMAPAMMAASAAAALNNPIAQLSLVLTGMVGTGARIYESKPVRQLMIKLANTPKNTPAERQVLMDLTSALNSSIQAYSQTQEPQSAEATNF